MIKRTSFVWKRPELSDAEFRQVYLGEHIAYAKQLPGLLEYTVDFVTEGPKGAPSAIATLLFESRAALDAAFSIPQLKDNLMRTRDQFASRVEVMIVDEKGIVP